MKNINFELAAATKLKVAVTPPCDPLAKYNEANMLIFVKVAINITSGILIAEKIKVYA